MTEQSLNWSLRRFVGISRNSLDVLSFPHPMIPSELSYHLAFCDTISVCVLLWAFFYYYLIFCRFISFLMVDQTLLKIYIKKKFNSWNSWGLCLYYNKSKNKFYWVNKIIWFFIHFLLESYFYIQKFLKVNFKWKFYLENHPFKRVFITQKILKPSYT